MSTTQSAGSASGVGPVQHEDPLLAPLDQRGQPVGEAGRELGGDLVGDEAAGRVEQPDLDQLGDRVDQPGAAEPARLDVADHAELAPPPSSAGSSLITSMAPSAARMPQRIAPPSNAGPAGAAVERIRSPSLSTISQLVPTSMKSRVRLSRSMPGGEHAGDDVAADVGAERGEEHRAGPGVQREPEVGGEHGRRLRRST